MVAAGDSPKTHLQCAGCGHVAPPDEVAPFRCPRAVAGAVAGAVAAADVDHVMTRILDPAAVRFFGGSEKNPFLRYRELFHAYHLALRHGLTDRAFVDLVKELDAAVAVRDGQGFRITPWGRAERMSAFLDCAGEGGVWIKDETGNVSGSHKARHLMGIMLFLRVLGRTGLMPEAAASPSAVTSRPALAIASCGNAALAAAVVAAAAAEWPLEVYIPPDADPSVVERLQLLGARLTICERTPGEQGDPCFLRFREAVTAGALPFACQGSENGLTIEGGATLGYEIVSSLVADRQRLDRLLVQVGGGALASACIMAFTDAVKLGLQSALPQIHAVQTNGASPLRRAYDRLVERILIRFAGDGTPGADDEERAEFLYDRASSSIIREELDYAATHRSEFMWPWEEEPRSVAHGILDDETYDWLAIVKGMIVTGGYPVVVSEELLEEAHRLTRELTGIPADHTGTAGLAGLLRLRQLEAVDPREVVGVLMTGVERALPEIELESG